MPAVGICKMNPALRMRCSESGKVLQARQEAVVRTVSGIAGGWRIFDRGQDAAGTRRREADRAMRGLQKVRAAARCDRWATGPAAGASCSGADALYECSTGTEYSYSAQTVDQPQRSSGWRICTERSAAAGRHYQRPAGIDNQPVVEGRGSGRRGTLRRCDVWGN